LNSDLFARNVFKLFLILSKSSAVDLIVVVILS
jgi:hypothetical protein